MDKQSPQARCQVWRGLLASILMLAMLAIPMWTVSSHGSPVARNGAGPLTRLGDYPIYLPLVVGTGGATPNSTTVNTPGGPVQVSLQGGRFIQGPTVQSMTPPEGWQALYGAIAFTAQASPGSVLTLMLTFPQTIPQGAVLKKYVNGTWQDVPGSQLSGNTATYQVQDGGALDGDGQANGQVVDPVALLTPVQQVEVQYPPGFGAYEELRRWAHEQCMAQAQGDAKAYRACLVQLAANPAICSSGDFVSFQNCTGAIMAGYPWPAPPVLTSSSYRIEITGGFKRERDPYTGAILREDPVLQRLYLTLDRTQDGRYFVVQYREDGTPAGAFWMNASCEILDPQGTPTMDALVCPVHPEKPYLLILMPSPVEGLVPSASLWQGGMLQDDWDEDGKAEPGYLVTSGTGGSAGGVAAVGYHTDTKLAKYRIHAFRQARRIRGQLPCGDTRALWGETMKRSRLPLVVR